MRFALVSFRLGGPDGVSVEAAKWAVALSTLGHTTYRVAGTFGGSDEGDVVVPGLAYPAGTGAGATEAPPGSAELETALELADVVVVENMFGLPLNTAASGRLAEVLADRPAIGHHHDLPSQRPGSVRLPSDVPALFPPPLPHMAHVTINEVSRRELESRGIAARVVPNTFEPDPPPGPRARELRSRLGISGPGATLALVPSRVVPRKNIGLAIEFCEVLAAETTGPVVLLVTGPVEDGHADAFRHLCDGATVTVEHHPGWFGATGAFSVADAYTAADVVVFASLWEGFGNPVMESVAYSRPLVVSPYPVLAELEALGFAFTHLDANPADTATEFLSGRTAGLVEPNRALLRAKLSPARLVGDLAEVIASLH